MEDLSLVLEPRPQAARQARDEIRARLAGHTEPSFLHDLLLVVSELVTNSVTHGPGRPIRLRLSKNDDGSVRGEVEDDGDGLVAIREMIVDQEGGRGLRIVDQLTDRWAVYEGSTHVWFEMSPGSP